MLTIEKLRAGDSIIFECVSGSRAQGLDSADSDTDIRGVFVLPKDLFYGMSYTAQVNDERNDVVYYELGRFIELLSKNNPNALELLSTPKEFVRIVHPLISRLKPDIFISKLCQKTFTGYASKQISKARGLNKKVNNPMPKVRASVLDFCFITQGHHSKKLLDFLNEKGWKQEDCGLSKMANMTNVYALFHNPKIGYQGVLRQPDSDEVSLSSVPKEEKMVCHLYFGKSAYSSYCRQHAEYWHWVKNRNEERYQRTKEHGKNYDAKNMMHTIRLLRMAKEIGEERRLRVKRADRDELLEMKAGKFEYHELIDMSRQLIEEIELAYADSTLPEKPNMTHVDQLLSELRNQFYDSAE